MHRRVNECLGYKGQCIHSFNISIGYMGSVYVLSVCWTLSLSHVYPLH